jgi:beta-galactosidase
VVGIERDSLLGVYRALYPLNVPLDFVHLEQLTPEELAGYKLVLLPYPLVLPAKAAGLLRGYVANGGALVAEARLGWNDERGRASDTIPGLGLAEVMGCREADVETVRREEATLEWTAEEIARPGELIAGRWYRESLEPLGPHARVVARFPDGTAGAVLSKFGRGRTLMLGTYAGAAFETQRGNGARRFYEALLAWAGIEPPVRVTGDHVEARYLESGHHVLAFAFNHGNRTVEAEIRFRDGARAGTDLVTGARVENLLLRLEPYGVRVLRLEVK